MGGTRLRMILEKNQATGDSKCPGFKAEVNYTCLRSRERALVAREQRMKPHQ
jgi:hypothetical protein